MTDNAFTRGVRIAARRRATKNGVLTCEGCGKPIVDGDCRVDHIIAKGLRGSRELWNAQVLCRACYLIKDAADNRIVKRAIKLAAAHLGTLKLSRGKKLQGRGFPPRPPKPSPCAPTSKTLPRRPL
jgi:5-methylcytosine-specific restriction endonuclease McrA